MKLKAPLYLLICTTALIGCGKDDNAPIPVLDPDPVQEPVQPKDTVIYVAGYQINGYDKQVVTLWTDQEPQILSDDFSNNQALGLEIIEEDPCLVGYGKSPNRSSVAKLWKNGEETTLFDEDDDSFATAICSYDGVFYVAASYGGDGIIKAWANNIDTDITDGTYYSYASDIAVDETGTFIAGHSNKTHEIATIWKNATALELTNGTYNARANAIFLADGDVYAGGYETNNANVTVAKIWKNGQVVELGSDIYNTQVNSIFVKGKDVYAGGSEISELNRVDAVIWKNGIRVPLENGGYTGSIISKIKVIGDDVYACGSITSGAEGYTKPVIWKNGKPIFLETSYNSGIAYDLKIVIK